MPIIIPTPEEIARMGERERAKWRKRMGVALREVEQSRQVLAYGELVREQATVWERIYGLDPDWRQHQRELLEVAA